MALQVQGNCKIKIGLFMLANGLPASGTRQKLSELLSQTQNFSEIHILSSDDYMQSIDFEDLDKNIYIHTISCGADDFSERFRNILTESDCEFAIFTNGDIIYTSKYSVERNVLRAKLADKLLLENDTSDYVSKQKSADTLFGKLDKVIFSRRKLLDADICLNGLSECDQALFLAEAISELRADTLVKLPKGSSFSKTAELWARELNHSTFENAVALCGKLFEVSKKREVLELAELAKILTENILKVSGKFISPYEPCEKIHILMNGLANAAGELQNVVDIQSVLDGVQMALESPVLTVIIPVYNSEKEISRCLGSVLTQTYKSIEVICVNDGSKDNSLKILREFESKYESCYVLTQENAGQGAARNRAIDIAKGKFIGFVDSDDWVEPNMFEKMVLALEFNPNAQIVKCGTHCDYTYPVTEAEKRGLENYFSEQEPEGVHDIGPDSLMTGGPCDKLYRTSLIKDNKIKFPEGVKNEDEAFVLFCVCNSKQFVLLKDKFYHYIRTSSGTMSTQNQMSATGKMPDVFSVCNLMLDFLYREKKYSYIGRVIKAFLGAADRFEASPIEDKVKHAVATLLEKAQFNLFADTIVANKRAWCKTKARKYLALNYTSPFEFEDLSKWLPAETFTAIEPSKSEPALSFIIPVYNAESFLIPTIESLRNQTLKNIEILFIDDGSIDRSAEILECYKLADPRIRIISQENAGVSKSRNRGISEARGRYIAFVDSDDIVSPYLAEKCIEAADKYELEVLAFDYMCFDCASGKPLDHYWTIANRRAELPMGQVFGAEVFRTKQFAFYGSSCLFLWKTAFLRENNINFPYIKISEDMCFVVNAFSYVSRAMILPEVFYHYRRNVPGSAITAIKNSNKSDPRINTVPQMLEIIENIGTRKISISAKANLMGRLFSEMRFFSTLSDILAKEVNKAMNTKRDILYSYSSFLADVNLRKWIEDVLRNPLADEDNIVVENPKIKLPKLDSVTSFWWKRIVEKRKKTKKDLIVVIGFLGSETADPLDSWTFFSWLQAQKIPSKFVISSNSLFYKDLVQKKNTKDVIALKKSCLQDDHAAYFLRKLYPSLVRAKAILFEDIVWPWPLRAYFKAADWKLIFLQHGVTYFRVGKKHQEFMTRFNYVNVASRMEKALLESVIGCYEQDGAPYPNYVVAGFPRWDNLVQTKENSPEQKVIFIMFTWRDVFEKKDYNIKESVYYNSITTFIKSPVIEELKNRGVKVVFAPHHRLLDIAPEAVNEWPIELCQQKDISYWVKNASCLITDYSSIAWDFMLQKKPVIHWLMDRHDYGLGEDLISQLTFVNKKIREVSMPVETISELRKKLMFYADNDFKITEQENEKIAPFFPYREGFSRRVYENLCCENEQKGN